jgi:hypothetical protein
MMRRNEIGFAFSPATTTGWLLGRRLSVVGCFDLRQNGHYRRTIRRHVLTYVCQLHVSFLVDDVCGGMSQVRANVKEVDGFHFLIEYDRKGNLIDLPFFSFLCRLDKFIDVVPRAGINDKHLCVQRSKLLIVVNQSRRLRFAERAKHARKPLGKNKDNILFAQIAGKRDSPARGIEKDQTLKPGGYLGIALNVVLEVDWRDLSWRDRIPLVARRCRCPIAPADERIWRWCLILGPLHAAARGDQQTRERDP